MQGEVSFSLVNFDVLILSFGSRLCDRFCDGPSLGFACSQEHGDDAHSQGLHILSSFLFGSVGGMIGDVTDLDERRLFLSKSFGGACFFWQRFASLICCCCCCWGPS